MLASQQPAEEDPGSGPDLGMEVFSIPVVPGETTDAIIDWTGQRLGWDIYGHVSGDGSVCTPDANGFHSDSMAPNYREWCDDHRKPFPVILPELQNSTFGGFYSGSPFLGRTDFLPPGEGGLNPTGAVVFMWHSHTEFELLNNDVFPGGLFTMAFIEPPSEPLDPDLF
jgi:hypothetical protein